jgi:hypothetical protein
MNVGVAQPRDIKQYRKELPRRRKKQQHMNRCAGQSFKWLRLRVQDQDGAFNLRGATCRPFSFCDKKVTVRSDALRAWSRWDVRGITAKPSCVWANCAVGQILCSHCAHLSLDELLQSLRALIAPQSKDPSMERAISFTLNGKPTRVTVDDERMLLWVLRSDLGLTGAKFGCGAVVRRLHCDRRQGSGPVLHGSRQGHRRQAPADD